MSKEYRNNNIWIALGLFALLMIIGVVVMFFLINKNETRISEEYEIAKRITVQCESGAQEDAFFSDDREQDVKNIIKILFVNDRVERLFYDYEGRFDSEGVASTVNATMHGKYNKFMSGKGMNPDSLKPTFQNSENKVQIILNADSNVVNNLTSSFFFLNEDDFQHIKSRQPDDYVKLYKGKGFSCEKHD